MKKIVSILTALAIMLGSSVPIAKAANTEIPLFGSVENLTKEEAQAEIDELKNLDSSLKEELNKANTELENLDETKQEKAKQVNDLAARSEALTTDLNKAKIDLSGTEDVIKDLEGQIETLESRIKELKASNSLVDPSIEGTLEDFYRTQGKGHVYDHYISMDALNQMQANNEAFKDNIRWGKESSATNIENFGYALNETKSMNESLEERGFTTMPVTYYTLLAAAGRARP